MTKGSTILVAAGQDPERFNGNAIDMCLPIKQGLDQGVPLRRAVVAARASTSDELRRQPDTQALAPPTLVDMLEKLKGAGASIEAIIDVVEPLASRAAPDPPGSPTSNRRPPASQDRPGRK